MGKCTDQCLMLGLPFSDLMDDKKEFPLFVFNLKSSLALKIINLLLHLNLAYNLGLLLINVLRILFYEILAVLIQNYQYCTVLWKGQVGHKIKFLMGVGRESLRLMRLHYTEAIN